MVDPLPQLAEFTITPGTGVTQQILTFTPQTLVVENPSSSPAYFDNIDWWCPPYARVTKRWIAAPGRIAGPVVKYRADTLPTGAVALQPAVTEPLRLIFTDAALPEAQETFGAGAPVNPFNPQASNVLGTVSYVQGAPVTTNFVLDLNAIQVGWDSGPAPNNRPPTIANYELKVVGHQSGTVYVDAKFDASVSRAQGLALLSATDISVDVTFAGPQIAPNPNYTATISDIIPSMSVLQALAPPSPNIAGLLSNVSVGVAPATALPAAAKANRKAVRVTNPPTATQAVYVGYASTVTAGAPAGNGAQGVRIDPGQSQSFGVGPAIGLWGVVASATQVVQVEEVA